MKGRLPPALVRCPGCGLHLFPQAGLCPHCQGDLQKLGAAQRHALAKAEAALARLTRILERA